MQADTLHLKACYANRVFSGPFSRTLHWHIPRRSVSIVLSMKGSKHGTHAASDETCPQALLAGECMPCILG